MLVASRWSVVVHSVRLARGGGREGGREGGRQAG